MLTFEDLRAIDKSNMYDILKNFHLQIEDAVKIALKTKIDSISTAGIKNIIISGLGGSAIGGDLIRSYTNYEIKIPVSVNRNYTLPEYTSKDTLVIISSYSGNTEESVSAYNEAIAKGCKVVCITSGGEVEKIALKNKHTLIKIPGGYQPRSALGYSFFSLLILFSRLGFIGDKQNNIHRTIASIKENSANFANLRSDNNASIAIAHILKNHLPVIYSSVDVLDIVNLRWRGQISENAKILAYGNLFPEMNHNELVGWELNKEIMKKIVVVILRDGEDNTRIVQRMDITKKIFEKYAYEVIEIGGTGTGKLERIFDLIYLGDWVSYYLAVLNDIDPTPVDVIANLKNELEGLAF
jgi:glucose/mannose-6-phosphate isomerase